MTPDSNVLQSAPTSISILVVGPQLDTVPVFAALRGPKYLVTYKPYPTTAILALYQQPFQLVCCSAAIKPVKLLPILGAVKNASLERLIPVVMVVDLEQRVTTFPTFSWAGKFGLVHSQTSSGEWQALLDRLLN